MNVLYRNQTEEPTDAEIEALARSRKPWVWSLDPPDISSAQHRLQSIRDARRELGLDGDDREE